MTDSSKANFGFCDKKAFLASASGGFFEEPAQADPEKEEIEKARIRREEIAAKKAIAKTDEAQLVEPCAAVSDANLSNLDVLNGSDTLCDVAAGHELAEYARRLADSYAIPRSTAFLTLLGVSSAALGAGYRIEDNRGDYLPIGLFVAAEQSSGTAKTSFMKTITDPFRDALGIVNSNRRHDIKVIHGRINALGKDADEERGRLTKELDELPRPISLFVDNVTLQAVESELMAENGGYFSLASTEQDLLSVMFEAGGTNKHLPIGGILKGFAGEDVSTRRVTRGKEKTFEGEAHGSIVILSQEGTIDLITGANGERDKGLLSRFMIESEPNFAFEVKMTDQPPRPDNQPYRSFCKKAAAAAQDCNQRFRSLLTIKVPAALTDDIAKVIDHVREHSRDGEKYSHKLMRSIGAKVPAKIAKVAAILSATDDAMGGGQIKGVVSKAAFDTATRIVMRQLEDSLRVLREVGIMGETAEELCVLECLEKSGRPMLESALYEACRRKSVFRDLPKTIRNDAVRKAAMSLIRCGQLSSTRIPGTTFSAKLGPRDRDGSMFEYEFSLRRYQMR